MKPDEIFSHWKQVRTDLVTMVGRFTEAELAYVPFDGAWPVGQIMLHIAEAEEGWFRYIVMRELNAWSDQYTLENYPRKEAILEALSEVHQHTEQYLATLKEEDLLMQITAPRGEVLSLNWIIWHVIEHEIHHRGELSLILGMLGREGWGA